MTRSAWSVVTTAVATLLTASTVVPASAAPAAADPLAGAPAVGECRSYTADDRLENHEDSPAVDCNGPHTALVVKVAIAPDKYDLSGRPSAQLQRFAAETCQGAWKDAIGASHTQQHMVVYIASWFAPSKAQLAEGARWIRCDVNAFDNRQLGNLPAATPFVDGNIDRGDRRCLTAKTAVVPCTASHKWIVRGLVRAPDGPYSTARQDAFAKKRCQRTLKRSDSRVLWWRVSKPSWQAGERHIACYGNGR